MTRTRSDETTRDGLGLAAPVIRWMLEDQITIPGPQEFLHGLCIKIVESGIPLARVAAFIRTLHPNIMGRRFLWSPEEGSRVSEAPYEVLYADGYLRSPAARVSETGVSVRRRLIDPACPNDFPILDELRADGITDYLMTPLRFTNGEIHSVSWTTQWHHGFTEAQIDALEAISVGLSRVAEIYALRRTATSLLSTYIGRDAGSRVLKGHIRRGDIERIRAVIWLSDLRGFTSLSERLDGKDVIELLNNHFDCLVPTIEAHGGQVLKFMGDGLLAIFPLDQHHGKSDAETCASALSAAREAFVLAAERDSCRDEGQPSVPDFGVALHLGDIHYGNIGGVSRLDFTAIGPAVNLAARLEGLTRVVDHPIILSAEFASFCGTNAVSIGRFDIKGLSGTIEAFAPRS